MERAAHLAGGKEIGVAGADVVQQCLRLGVVDELRVDLVPVLFGRGIRWFADLETDIMLDDPVIVPGTRVTHLSYQVRRRDPR